MESLRRDAELPGPASRRAPAYPRRRGAWAIGSFRQADIREALAPLSKALKPEYRQAVDAAERALVDLTTRELRDELSRSLGPAWCVYASPSMRADSAGSADPAFLIEVRDSDAAGAALDKLVTRANAYFREQRPGAGLPVMAFEALPAPERGYRLTSPAKAVTWLSDQLAPTVLLGKSYVAAAATPDLARAAVAGEKEPARRFKPGSELLKSFECLPEKLSFLIAGNPRDSFWPDAISRFPGTAEPFLRRFIGLPIDGPTDEVPATDLLGLLGVKRGRVPTADELRSHLFPSLIAGIVDDRTFRLIALEALPLAFLGAEIKFSDGGPNKEIAVEVKFHPGKAA